MSTDVYLEAHAARDDFSLDQGDETIGWRKNWVALSWMMFFCEDYLAVSPHGSEAPHLTARRTEALGRYRTRLRDYGPALKEFAGDAPFGGLADYVEARGFEWLSIRTWEV